MCADKNFRVIVNLSNFFHDHRNKARILINEGIKTIRDLEERIETIFHLNKIHLTSQNEFLPPSEDVGILRNDEIVWVIQNEDYYDEPTRTPVTENKKPIQKESKKRQISPTQECIDKELKSPKKKQKRLSTTTEGLLSPQNEEPKKKRKEKSNAGVITEKEISLTKQESSKKKQKRLSTTIERLLSLQNEEPKKKKKRKEKSNAGVIMEKEISVTKQESPKKKQKHLSTTTERLLSPQNEEPKKMKKRKEKSSAGVITEKEISVTKQESLKKKKRKKHNRDQTEQEGSQLPHSNEEAKRTKKDLDVNVITGKTIKDATTKKKKIKKTVDEAKQIATTGKEGANGSKMGEVTKVQKLGLCIRPYNRKTNTSTNCSEIAFTVGIGNKLEESILVPDNEFATRDYSVDDHLLSKRKYPIPTTTNQYLQRKKINIVKIEHLNITPKTSSSGCQKDKEEAICHDLIVDEALPIAQAEEESIGEGNTTEDDEEGSVLNSTLLKQTDTCSESKKTSSPSNEEQYEQVIAENMETELSDTGENLNATNEPSKTKAGHGMDTFDEGADACRTEHNRSLNDTEIGSLPSLSRKESNCSEGDDANDLNTVSDETIKPSDTSMMDITKDYESCSSTSAPSKAMSTSGVGHLLAGLRGNDSNVSVDDLNNPIKTRRKRVRRRNKKNATSIKDTSAEPALVPENRFIPITKSMKEKDGPEIHVKFVNREDGTLVPVDVKSRRDSLLDTEQSATKKITKNKISESDILNSPFMASSLPKAGDKVAFKILIIKENCTPGVSSLIIGKVVEYDKESSKVLFEILSGLDQCDIPNGIVPIDEDSESDKIKDNRREFKWFNQVLEPRLLDPQLNII